MPTDGSEPGVVAVAAGGDAAHVNRGEARLRRLEADRRELLGIFLEVRNIELIELARAEHGHRDRDVLQILLALRRGDDDVALVRGAGAAALRAGRRRRAFSRCRRRRLIARLRLRVLRESRRRQCGGSEESDVRAPAWSLANAPIRRGVGIATERTRNVNGHARAGARLFRNRCVQDAGAEG